MIFRDRLRAMGRLGTATLRVAERTFLRRVASEDGARVVRLGDVAGQTRRAQRFADALESDVLIEFADPQTVKPGGWFR